ncbi:MAG: hypothetical protein HYZ10_11490 [Ignavibacteriales bacterium]|nr:MAG: hypothetical protein FD122_1588 [Stygiobacter sp.]KAF0216796.1 MAG: hypothetical protein FD178_969 [Ignavibacteria bacterium]MBI3125016.1 hypothetical protein [Ignavibacteriales bacterium]OGU67189.1 MAG: hypothetical protein A2X62_14600 [Stygiobacter sp. GWC2_38_9]OGV08421.1 MAG: hypothetical protein A2299_09975 [Stygiobacter sp. RIFOXYB2_FULL_37_11]OGV13974.1 MAG: hypothetical protein A2237_10915 [Stygiobacter sp. RIFOXYA2_FULL_38_8]OGV14412.1 MAG: hypothetical protein A2440_08200 [S
MKAGIYFTGSGPIVILTTYDSLTNPYLINRLHSKGIKKFIAFEIPEYLAKQKYGHHYDAVMEDVKQEDYLRVIDFDGHHILAKFSFKELGEPIYYES